MLDYDTQKEIVNETMSPTKVLEVAIYMEMGTQNQQKINQNLNTNAHLLNFQKRNCTTNYQQQRIDFTRYPSVPQNSQYTIICANCGQRWSHNHRRICPAKDKKYNNCGIMGHSAKNCWKP